MSDFSGGTLVATKDMRATLEWVDRFGGGMPLALSYLTTTAVPAQVDAGKGAGNSRSPVPHLPQLPLPGFTSAGASGGIGGGLLAFAILLFSLLLVIPNAVRWLRPALALGLSPAYVAIGDRPG
jgi:hypothetical protein